MKASKILWFYDDFRRNRSTLIYLNRIILKAKFWRRFLSIEKPMFYDDFRRNRSTLIHLNSHNIKSEIWRRFLTKENGHAFAFNVLDMLLT